MFKFSNHTYETIYSGLRRVDSTGGHRGHGDADRSASGWRIWAPSLAFAVIAALIIVH